jgi:hypothetical protein
VVVGDLALLEGDQILIIEGIGALAADDGDIALVELEADRPVTNSWLLSIRACSISRSGENQKPL